MASQHELLLKILSDDSVNDTPEKCRERRRRRIQLRRLRSASAPIQQLLSPEPGKQMMTNYVTSTKRCAALSKRTAIGDKRAVPVLQMEVDSSWTSLTSARDTATTMGFNPMPVYGWISIQGFSDSMDDRLLVKEEFCRSNVFGGNPLHFFAVYDGHGGSHVSTLCKNMMHRIMAEELTRLSTAKAHATSDAGSSSSSGGSSSPAGKTKTAEVNRVEGEWEDLVRAALEKSFLRMDQVALSTCACGKSGYLCWCQPVELGFAGSTAVVAILTPNHVVVANCGDSRAVLCRAARPIPLSLDHKV